MMKEDKNIDQIFHDKFAGFEKTPPAFVWDNIQGQLASQKRRKLLVYWRVAGVAAVLLIAFMAGWQFNKNTETNPEIVARNITQQPVQNENTEAVGENILPVAGETTVVSGFAETSVAKTVIKPLQVAVLDDAKVGTEKDNEQKIERPGLIASLQAVLKMPVSGTKELAVKSPLMEKVLFSAEELRIIEENKALLAMNHSVGDEHKWMVGASVSPVYSVSQSSQKAEYARAMAAPESGNNLNMAGGFSFEYKTSSKWSFQSGVYYNKMEQASANSARVTYAENSKDRLNTFFSAPVSGNNGVLEMNSVAGVIQIDNLPSSVQMEGALDRELSGSSLLVQDARFDQNFEYLEIPLFAKYQLIDSKVDVQVLSGISTNILVGNNVYLQDGSGRSKIGRTDGMVDLNYSGVLGLGFSYSLTSKLFLNIEPRFKYYFSSLNEDPDISYKPYSFGVYTGISYSF